MVASKSWTTAVTKHPQMHVGDSIVFVTPGIATMSPPAEPRPNISRQTPLSASALDPRDAQVADT